MGFKLWMSGEIQGDVYDDYRAVRAEVEDAINLVLNQQNYGDGLVKWYHIPIIRAFDSPIYDEIKRHHKRKHYVEFRLKIPHSVFKSADSKTQRKLFMDMLLRSIDEMKAMKIPNFDLQKLESDMRELAAAKGWV